MWEFECHDWKTLQGFGDSTHVRLHLERVLGSSNEEEWNSALGSLAFYASYSGVPSEATKDVVACLVAIAIRTEGRKRSAVLGTLEELTGGSGIEEYSPQQLTWLRAAVRELARAFYTWAQLAESASVHDATYGLGFLAYCAVYVPELESKGLGYLQLCATERPELTEEISALLINFKEVKRLLSEREAAGKS